MSEDKGLINKINLAIGKYIIVDRIDPWDHGTPNPGHGHKEDCVHIFRIKDSGGRFYACKIVETDKDKHNHSKFMVNEIETIRKLSECDYIIRLIDVGHISGLLYFTMPYYTANLTEMTPSLSREQTDKILFNIEFSIRAMSAEGINHRDLTPENILVDENLSPVISDFQVACSVIHKDFDMSGRGKVDHCCGECDNVNLNDLTGRINGISRHK